MADYTSYGTAGVLHHSVAASAEAPYSSVLATNAAPGKSILLRLGDASDTELARLSAFTLIARRRLEVILALCH